MVWRIDDPQGDEAGKVKYLVVPYTRGAVLDMGCGPSKAFPHFIGVDDCKDTALFGIRSSPTCCATWPTPSRSRTPSSPGRAMRSSPAIASNISMTTAPRCVRGGTS
jgi:hypothetical protein